MHDLGAFRANLDAIAERLATRGFVLDAAGFAELDRQRRSSLTEVEQLKAQDAGDIVFFGGGTIPPEDAQRLRDLGVRAIFTPGAPLGEIVDFVQTECGKRRALVG